MKLTLNLSQLERRCQMPFDQFEGVLVTPPPVPKDEPTAVLGLGRYRYIDNGCCSIQRRVCR